jgi:hypothetical protein
MKILSTTIVIILFISCNPGTGSVRHSLDPQNAKKISVQLIDSLGVIELFVPTRYDTNFTWIDYSDCGKPCNEQKYRFQPKSLPITKESGWIWLGEPKDSIERFTIIHKGYFPFHDGDTAKNMLRHNRIREDIISVIQQPSIIIDTVQKIQDRYFSIIAIQKKDDLYYKKVTAVTTIKSNEVMFQYELLSRSNDSLTKNFINNSLTLIKFIKIEKGL